MLWQAGKGSFFQYISGGALALKEKTGIRRGFRSLGLSDGGGGPPQAPQTQSGQFWFRRIQLPVLKFHAQGPYCARIQR